MNSKSSLKIWRFFPKSIRAKIQPCGRCRQRQKTASSKRDESHPNCSQKRSRKVCGQYLACSFASGISKTHTLSWTIDRGRILRLSRNCHLLILRKWSPSPLEFTLRVFPSARAPPICNHFERAG